MADRDLARVAYEAYRESCGGLSVRGESLPDWSGQQPEIREHWRAAIDAVLMFADLAVLSAPDARARRAYQAYARAVDGSGPWEGLTEWQQRGWIAVAAAR